ncbi:ParA family protein [Leptolyngbya sp. AN02str]|uniref:ParA family protein n=1 Tax=Leptolyngbya sp. AN02str TaxID=3423363 RepID=UPI003D3120BF
MQIVVAVSLSGGQGKTTLTLLLSRLLNQMGKKVLVLDADPQANLTFYTGTELARDEPSLLEVLQGSVEIAEAIVEASDGLFIVPSDTTLSQVNDFLAASGASANILRLRLKPVRDIFDFCLIDVQPTKSQLSVTALGAADLLIIPAEATTKGTNSVLETLTFVDKQEAIEAFRGSILGIVPFRDRWVGSNQTEESRDNVAAMKEIAQDREIALFPSILESEQFKRAIRQGKSLAELGYPNLEYPLQAIVEAINE